MAPGQGEDGTRAPLALDGQVVRQVRSRRDLDQARGSPPASATPAAGRRSPGGRHGPGARGDLAPVQGRDREASAGDALHQRQRDSPLDAQQVSRRGLRPLRLTEWPAAPRRGRGGRPRSGPGRGPMVPRRPGTGRPCLAGSGQVSQRLLGDPAGGGIVDVDLAVAEPPGGSGAGGPGKAR